MDFQLKGENTFRILDIGCGGGVFGFMAIAKCLEKGILVENALFSDIDKEALRVCRANCKGNRDKLDYVSMEVVESDMFDKIEGKFDIITCNFPQTPSKRPFKGYFLMIFICLTVKIVDRWGKEDGSYFKSEFMKGVKSFLKPNSQIFMMYVLYKITFYKKNTLLSYYI